MNTGGQDWPDLAPDAELLELGDAFIELDREWRILRVNRNEEKLSKKLRSETVGRKFWDVFPDIALPTTVYWREYHRCMAQRVAVQFEDHYAPLDMWTGVTAYPTSTGGIAVFFRDISDRKRSDEELRASRAELEIAQRIAHVGSWSWTVATGVLEASDEARRIYGYDSSAPLPLNDTEELRRFYTQEGWDRRSAAFRQALSDGRSWERDEQIARPDGSMRWVHFRGEAERDTAGRIIKLRGTIQDITERKLAAEAMARSEAVLAQAGAMAHVGAWWIDISNRDDINANPLRWSAEVFRMFGYEPGEVEVSNALFFEHVHPADRQRVTEAVAQALATKSPYSIEHRIIQRGGAERIVMEHAEARFDDAGRPLVIFGAVHDITEQKRAHEAVQEADQRKTEFLGVLSHELRNPLAPIRNSIFLLEKLPADSPQAARARQVIRRQTEHLTRLVDDLLDVTRIERGKVQLNREVVDLRNLVRRTCEDHRAIFEESEIEMNLDFPVAPVWANVDSTRIAQVVGNLLANAVKFTPAHGAVTVRLRGHEGHATISVHDTGTGMAPEHVARMFEPFAQEDRSLARTRGGLGLGLALSKGLIELHGGTIAAHSGGPGKGSDFTITLPLAARKQPVTDIPAGALGSASRRRVLVIEDNIDAARTLADVLEIVGHEVTVTRDGTTGIALARELKPDVVICDVGLPDVDGYEVARTLRQDEALRSTRLIALSGYAQPEDKERAWEAGFNAHLPKPAPINELAELLA